MGDAKRRHTQYDDLKKNTLRTDVLKGEGNSRASLKQIKELKVADETELMDEGKEKRKQLVGEGKGTNDPFLNLPG